MLENKENITDTNENEEEWIAMPKFMAKYGKKKSDDCFYNSMDEIIYKKEEEEKERFELYASICNGTVNPRKIKLKKKLKTPLFLKNKSSETQLELLQEMGGYTEYLTEQASEISKNTLILLYEHGKKLRKAGKSLPRNGEEYLKKVREDRYKKFLAADSRFVPYEQRMKENE